MEFRRALVPWKLTPKSSRPSLRTLACELGTSHQLLAFYLRGLDKWQSKEYSRQASEIRTRAIAEGRTLTQWEEQQAHDCDRAGLRAILTPILLDDIKRMKEESERRLLCRQEIKALKLFARSFPDAQELLQKCLQNGIKKRKRFAEIVKETPRGDGETCIAWVRRIWNQCAIYDTQCPEVITEEFLEKCSEGSAENRNNNLPPAPSGVAKSFG